MQITIYKIKNSLSVMLKLIARLICYLAFLFTASNAIAGWNQLSSPTSQNLNGVWFADSTTGVCVGDNGAVARTNDGMTFLDYSISGGTNLNGVHVAPDVVGVPAYENLNAYIVIDPGGDGTVATINSRYEAQVEGLSQEFMDTYVTIDYGPGFFDDTVGYTHYFDYTLSPTNQDYNYICPWAVADAEQGYFDLNTGYSFCIWEENNGQTDIEIYNNNAITFYSCNIEAGWAGPGTRVYGTVSITPGGNADVWLYQDASRTTLIPFQGGACSWPLSTPASSGSYRYLYAINTDTRAGWSNMNSMISRNIDINEPNIYAAATADNVYRSTSAGAGWYPDNTGSGAQLNDVHFVDDQNGWAVGGSGSIYTTSNAGETWISQSSGAANLQSIFFMDSNNGWIAGTGGTILYTSNGGSLWQSPVSGVPAVDLYDIHFVSTTVGWAVGFNGTVIKTTDGGVNWVAQTSGTTNQLNGVHFVDANTGYAAGVNDTILKTTDGGTTWIPQTSPSLGNNFNDLYFIDANTGYICGDGGAILRTTDGGAGAAGNQIVMHPTASTATDQFALSGCASSFDCVNDQPGNAATGYALAVNNDGPFYLNGDNGNQVLFDLADSGSVGIPAGSTIDSIEIFAQAYRENAGGGATYQLSYDIGGGLISEPAGTALVRGNYQMMSYAWSSLSWTTAQLDNLKIGVVQSGNSTSHLGQLYVVVTYSLLPNTAAVGGYAVDDIIPTAQVSQATDGSGVIMINWKARDSQPDLVTLLNFEYSDDEGSTWYTPAGGDASAALSANWADNGGVGWTTGTLFSNAPVHSFTFDTKHADLSGRLDGVDQSDVQIRFTLNDGTVNSSSPVTSESFRVDNVIPTSTVTSASYEAAIDSLVITGTNFLSIDPATTDIKDYVDWAKFIWDINGDDTTTADISVALAEVTSLTITDDTTLTLVFTGAKAIAIEATSGYGGADGLDTLDVTAGFIRDEFGNTATTDAVTGGPLDVEAPAAITDLAINGLPTFSTVGLIWTSPGDDLNSGIATTYDIRYSTSPINDGNWAAATQVAGEPAPQLAGSTEYFTVSGLSSSQTYYFAIKTSDEIPKESALSNSTNATTGVPPAGTYYWQRSDGLSIAGFTTNSPSCGAEVDQSSLTTTTMSAGGFVCNYMRITATSSPPMEFMLLINDTPYSGPTQVTGGNFRLTFQQEGGSTGIVARYELGYALGGIFTSWGYVDTIIYDNNSAALVTDLSSISGTAPAGSYLAFKITDQVTSDMRAYYGPGEDNSGILNVTEIEGDPTPPAAITDLTAITASATSIRLDWTAPGDDGNVGTASLYDIRYSTSPITDDATFNAATQVTGEPAPQIAGSSETFTVNGLDSSTTYYFAIKTRDEVPNISALSNVVSLKPDIDPPADITDLATGFITGSTVELTWTATGDDGNVGTATTYDIRYRTDAPIDASNWATATQVTGESAPQIAGTAESYTVMGLTPTTTYYFAIMTADEVPNWSGVSNSPTVDTLTAPADITDLAVFGSPTSSTVSLTWTAPGDDGMTGTASSYDIRYSTSPITDANWASATQVVGEPAPLTAGSTEYFTVNGLNPNQLYYFAIKASNSIPSESGLSNVVNATTGSPPSGTYYFRRPAGGTVAGFGIDNETCLDQVSSGSMYVTTMNGSGYDCNWIRFETVGSPQDLMLMISDTPYSGPTTVTGIDYSNNFVDDNGGGVVVRYELGYASGGVFTSWGSVDTPNWDSGLRTDDLSSISGIAPAGSYLAFKIIQVSSGQLRMWPGSSYPDSGILNVSEIEEDSVAPAAITDLVASLASPTSIDLTWTAPGDDGSTGTASLYDIRYSTNPITDANWATATQVVGEPAPQVAGSSEAFTVMGLTAGQTYYFAVKTRDEVPNISLLSNIATRGFNITGKVFEDSDFNGAAANWTGDAGDLGLANVDVELYDNSDVYQASTTTDVNGDYTFSGLSDSTTYKVRVRSATIGDDPGGPNETAPMGGFNACVPGTCAEPLPEMTWGYSLAMVGGQNANTDDTATADNGGPGDTWVSVAIAAANVTGVNFGFAYNLITNTGDDTNNVTTRSKQGSIRQFIKNSNAIGTAGGTTANYAQFFIPNTDPNMQTSGADDWFRIGQAALAMPSIEDAGTVIDGRTQATNVPGNVNSQGPEIELDGSGAGAVNGIFINNVANTTIRDLVINNYAQDAIYVFNAGTTGTVIYGNYIGIDALGETAAPNQIGIRLLNGANDIDIGGVNAGEGNLISGNDENSIVLANADNVRVRGNIIGTDKGVIDAVPNGTGTPAVGNININSSTNITIGDATAGNIISGNVDQGIQINGTSDNVYIQNNRIGTGPAGTENLPNTNGGISIVPNAAVTELIVGGTTGGLGNIIAYNGNFGVNVSKVDASILLNEIRDNANNGINVAAAGSGSSTWIYHNTITGNGSNGVYIDNTGVVMKNNIIAGNALYGYDTTQPFAGGYNFVTDDFNAPINGWGCCNGQAIGTGSISISPVNFTNYAGKDFTLDCSAPSTAIDTGCDYGAAGDDTACDSAADIAQPDVNGATAGNYNSLAPDMGAFESGCSASLSIVKQAWLPGGSAPLGAVVDVPTGTTIVFLIYVKNTSAGQVTDVRITDNLDETGFQYVAGSLFRDDGTISDVSTDLEIFNATAPGTGVNVTDAVDPPDIGSAQDTGGLADADLITIGQVPAQINGNLNINGNTTFAVRFEVIVK